MEAATDTAEATDDSRERSRGGVGDLDRSGTSGSSSAGVSCISAGGSAGVDEDDDGVMLGSVALSSAPGPGRR